MNSQAQIVLTPPAPTTASNAQFPMVMQMNSSSGGPFIYTYPDIHNKSLDTSSSNSGIGQVILSPVQNGLNILKSNGNSPSNIATMIIQQEPKSGAAHSLGEVFNVQTVPNMHNQAQLMQNNLIQTPSVPVSQPGNQPSSEIANLLSSLQVAGVQLVDTEVNKNPGVVLSNSGEQATDKSPINNLIKLLQVAGEENNFVTDNKIVNNVPVVNFYRLVDGSGNVTVITTGGAGEPVLQQSNVQCVTSQNDTRTPYVERYSHLVYFHFQYTVNDCIAHK